MFVYELHDLGILEIDEAFSFAVLGDSGKVGILLCEIVEVNVALVVGDLLHVDDSVLSCLAEAAARKERGEVGSLQSKFQRKLTKEMNGKLGLELLGS